MGPTLLTGEITGALQESRKERRTEQAARLGWDKRRKNPTPGLSKQKKEKTEAHQSSFQKKNWVRLSTAWELQAKHCPSKSGHTKPGNKNIFKEKEDQGSARSD